MCLIGARSKEPKVVTRACDSFRRPVRFVRFYQDLLVETLSCRHFALARKVARLSECQFARLYKQLKGQWNGSI